MKCPKCQYNQKRGKDGMVCKSCSREFIFDPKANRLAGSKPLHDSLFEKIISHASANGTYQFTPDQLFSSARHFGRESLIGCLIVFIIIAVVLTIGALADFAGLIVFACIIGTLLFLGGLITLLRGQGPKRKHWDQLLKQWQREGGQLPGSIKSPALSTPPPNWKEEDIYDYGVSGIILCDREETVDWLVLNQFHTQTNTLILTAGGYPDYLHGVARTLLEKKPDLNTYLLHGPGTSAKLLTEQTSLPVTKLTDLGLDEATISGLAVLQKRFGKKNLKTLPLDVIPYRTFSAALTHCLANGVLLGSILGANAADSDTDTSFG